MKACLVFKTVCHCCALVALLGLLMTGCKTTPKVDWNRRVGSWTYDQAVLDLGPPNKQAALSDGSTVAEWIKRSSGGVSFGLGTGYFGRHAGVGVSETVGTGYGDRVLRLTFGPDHKLVSWSRNY